MYFEIRNPDEHFSFQRLEKLFENFTCSVLYPPDCQIHCPRHLDNVRILLLAKCINSSLLEKERNDLNAVLRQTRVKGKITASSADVIHRDAYGLV